MNSGSCSQMAYWTPTGVDGGGLGHQYSRRDVMGSTKLDQVVMSYACIYCLF